MKIINPDTLGHIANPLHRTATGSYLCICICICICGHMQMFMCSVTGWTQAVQFLGGFPPKPKACICIFIHVFVFIIMYFYSYLCICICVCMCWVGWAQVVKRWFPAKPQARQALNRTFEVCAEPAKLIKPIMRLCTIPGKYKYSNTQKGLIGVLPTDIYTNLCFVFLCSGE